MTFVAAAVASASVTSANVLRTATIAASVSAAATVSADLTSAAPVVEIDYLVVAGGASALWRPSGVIIAYYSGGGGGGLRSTVDGNGGNVAAESKINLLKGNTYTIDVGGGGAASPSANTAGTSGEPSSISGTGITTITSTGGGRGVTNDVAGISGGSGSGAGGNDSIRSGGDAASPTQGFKGGDVSHTNGAGGGGGGGGAGSAGGNVAEDVQKGGTGGNAKSNTITGTSVSYAGGGPGGGGGFTPELGDFGTGYLHAANIGSGGYITSGASSVNSGSSGVVIIRSTIDITNSADYSGATRSTSGIYFIFTFNGNGSIKFS